MPGVRIAYALRPNAFAPAANREPPAPPRAFDATARRVYTDDRLVVDVEQTPGYPFERLQLAHRVVLVEGHVYARGRAALLRRLEVLSLDGPDDEAFATQLRAEAESADGDFLLVCYDPSGGRLGIAGDRFGRLPAYLHAGADRLVVARHPGFALAHMNEPAVDRTALAQLLLFGYPLGSRTLIEGVHRLLPGEVLVASPGGSRLFPPPASPFRRNESPALPPDADACARALRDAFVSACRDRHLDGHHHVLSLSGGMDSRTAGAGMRSAFGAFSSVTFVAPGSPHPDESAPASAVARALGSEWRALEFNHLDPACMDEIIRLKLGLSPVNVAFGLDYVRRVRDALGAPVAFWTGEGADKVLCEHRAIPARPGPDDLVRFIVAKNAVWDPDRVAALTGVHGDDLLAGVRSVATSVRGVDADDAYVHFLLAQRVVRWHTEGEDRHREAVWPIAPFFAREFFTLARAVPGRWKRGRRLYREFLRALSPELAALPLAGGHPAPGSRRFAVEYALREGLRANPLASALYRRVRNRRGARPEYGDVWRSQLAQLQREHAVPEAFDAAEIERVASGRVSAPSYALALLVTAVRAVRWIRRGESA
jgi:asparagine synthase (glutamine-hydrolysing)